MERFSNWRATEASETLLTVSECKIVIRTYTVRVILTYFNSVGYVILK